MCWAQFIGMGTQAGSGMLQGQQDAGTLNANADLLDIKAADAMKRGGVAEDIQRAKTAQIMGSQRAGMGASGVQVDSGTFGKVEEQTAAMGELDAQTIRSNAMREAWGYTQEANQARAQAAAAGTMQRLLLPGWENGKLGIGSKALRQGGVPWNLGKQREYISTGKI